MVELIVVIVLIGIIGTVAVGRFMDSTSFSSAAWADQVRAMLRYGQKLAIAQNRPVFVLLRTDRIALCFTASAACPAAEQVAAPGGANSGADATVNRCGGAWMCEALPAGLEMTVPAAHIAFDALGRASTPNGAAPRLSVKAKGAADAGAIKIAVENETGYVD